MYLINNVSLNYLVIDMLLLNQVKNDKRSGNELDVGGCYVGGRLRLYLFIKDNKK